VGVAGFTRDGKPPWEKIAHDAKAIASGLPGGFD